MFHPRETMRSYRYRRTHFNIGTNRLPFASHVRSVRDRWYGARQWKVDVFVIVMREVLRSSAPFRRRGLDRLSVTILRRTLR